MTWTHKRTNVLGCVPVMSVKAQLLLCLACWLVAPGSAHAGDDFGPVQTLAVGGKLGVSAVTLGGENPGGIVFQTTYKLTYAAGGFVSIPLHQLLAIQPELLLVGKGGGREMDGLDRGSWNMTYVELPILVHGRYPLRSNLSIHLLLGPELSFLLDGEIENENGETLNFTDDARALDVGLIFGAGTTWHLSRKGALVVEARYDLGMRSFDTNEEVDARNRAFTVMLGYQWALGAK